MRVIEISALPRSAAKRYVGEVARLLHDQWSDCDEQYTTHERAVESISKRIGIEPLFLALDDAGHLAGVAAIGKDDYYDGFCGENGIEPGYIGRDLVVVKAYRGRRYAGLKVWQLLLRAGLLWIEGQRGKTMLVFTERNNPVLVRMLSKSGARYIRQVVHRGPQAVTLGMFEYETKITLAMLRAVQSSWST